MTKTGEKIHKVLAEIGLGSRRKMEELIKAGRVTINGRVARVADRILPHARIRVDGKSIRRPNTENKTRVLMYHKPAGLICTRNDPEGRPTVFDRLPHLGKGRWISIGRLDLNTSGLLLFTNDGNLANTLMHPSSHIEREYAVRVMGEISADQLNQLRFGVKLEDGMANFSHIAAAGGSGINRWYHVTISSGRNRIVRRLWESQGLKVSRLTRIRFGDLHLPRSLQQGKFVSLDDDLVEKLKGES